MLKVICIIFLSNSLCQMNACPLAPPCLGASLEARFTRTPPSYRPRSIVARRLQPEQTCTRRKSMDNELIDAVYRREPIWDPANELHKNSNVLKKLWQEVADEVNKDAKSSKTRWKNLRAYYVKEWQKAESRTERSEQMSTWQYFDQLHFLKKTMVGPKYSHAQDYDEIFITNLDGTVSYPEELSPGQSSTEASFSITTRKRKLEALACTNDSIDRYTLLEIERRKLSILESEMARSTNDDLLFFESLLPYLKDIPMERKLRLRSKIQDLICGELNDNDGELNDNDGE